jgi:hypothetical protein
MKRFLNEKYVKQIKNLPFSGNTKTLTHVDLQHV